MPQGKVTVKEMRVKNQEFFKNNHFPLKTPRRSVLTEYSQPSCYTRCCMETLGLGALTSLSYTQILGVNSDVWGEEEGFWMCGDVPIHEIL